MPANSTYITGRTMLFDVVDDMTEEHDVAAENPAIVARLLARLQTYNLTHCNGGPCPDDKKRPGALRPPGLPTTDPSVMGQTPVWLPYRGDPSPGKCSTDR